jgi:hypothetical protein
MIVNNFIAQEIKAKEGFWCNQGEKEKSIQGVQKASSRLQFSQRKLLLYN